MKPDDSIYIPLCLYFNEELEQFISDYNLFTFHYVSILMIFSYLLLLLFCAIYIPLCLYFNPFPLLFHSSLFSFTFHYVSILMIFDKTQYVSVLLFTFHYVSILIAPETILINPIIDIYIPLCLYFNYMGKRQHRQSMAFTFHYVSILIRPPHLFLFSFFSTHFLSTYQ